MYEYLNELLNLVARHPEYLAAVVAAIAGGAYIYWPSDPFDIRETKVKCLSKEK